MPNYSSMKKPSASEQPRQLSDKVAKVQPNNTKKPSNTLKSTPAKEATSNSLSECYIYTINLRQQLTSHIAPRNQGWNASINMKSKAK